MLGLTGQDVVTAAVVLGAFGYIARLTARTFSAKSAGCASGCGACPKNTGSGVSSPEIQTVQIGLGPALRSRSAAAVVKGPGGHDGGAGDRRDGVGRERTDGRDAEPRS